MIRRIRPDVAFFVVGAWCAAGLALSSCGGGGSGGTSHGGTVIALVKDAPVVTTSDGKVVAKIFLGLQKVELLHAPGAAPVTIFDANAPGNSVKQFDLLSLQTVDFFAGVGRAPDGPYSKAIITLDPAASFEEAATPPVSYLLSVPGATTITITPPVKVDSGQTSLVEFDIQPSFITPNPPGSPTPYTLAAAITAKSVQGSNGHDVDGIGLTIVSVDCGNPSGPRLGAHVDDHQPIGAALTNVDISQVPASCLTDALGAQITCAQLDALLLANGDLDAEVQGTILPNGDIAATCVALQDNGNNGSGNSTNNGGNGNTGGNSSNGSNGQVNDEYLGTIDQLTVSGTTAEFDLLGARVSPLRVQVDASTVLLDDRPGATTRRLTVNDLRNLQTAEVEGDPVTPGTTSPIRATQIELQ